MMNAFQTDEQHPMLPSGRWKGFYLQGQSKHPMKMDLEFKGGQISGQGSDEVGEFSFSGHYDLERMRCEMIKTYSTHRISYSGHIDENGIWGKWFFATIPTLSEGFHIWPKPDKQQARVQAETTEAVASPRISVLL